MDAKLGARNRKGVQIRAILSEKTKYSPLDTKLNLSVVCSHNHNFLSGRFRRKKALNSLYGISFSNTESKGQEIIHTYLEFVGST